MQFFSAQHTTKAKFDAPARKRGELQPHRTRMAYLANNLYPAVEAFVVCLMMCFCSVLPPLEIEITQEN